MADNRQNFRVIDVATVHEVYANQFISAGYDGSSLSITLGTAVQIPEKMREGIKAGAQPDVYVTARLAISAPAMVDFITSVTGMLDRMGVMPAKAGAPARPPLPTDSGKPPAPAGKPFQGDTW